ncbi:MAG TPA: bifunctional serine/threonine-protein kinase/formylglycine-generating enzyme family protein [Polyangiaceae bacterium]|nr:bifunctional serine/threonine-protein kinase/formylglycine-generating enzyme family protein [Polyangiaceae bacterium]
MRKTPAISDTLATSVGDGAAGGERIEAPALPDRYEDMGRIASGSFGEVRRVWDRLLARASAVKILWLEHADDERKRERFLAEAEITAGLSHPGIVAVHDRGELADGRPWYAMQEVRGRTLEEAFADLHAGKTPEGFSHSQGPAAFRRAVDRLARAAQAVAHAHRHGIVHRDLKPANIMVGDLGEVLVMDWGLARRLGDPAEPPSRSQPSGDRPPDRTRDGDVLGTPAYMPPEQARGQRSLHGPQSDVYALGAILYHLLTGSPPYKNLGLAPFRAILAGPPEPIMEVARGGPEPPPPLVALCERAMAAAVEARHPNAGAFCEELLAWLDGALRREQAKIALDAAQAQVPLIAALRDRAAALRAEADALLGGARPFDALEKKEPGWAREDEARVLEVEVALRETAWLEAVHGALSVDPELPEAHAALADHYRELLRQAELAHRPVDAARFEARLRAHDRGRYASVLRGEGTLTLISDPAGASVRLERFVERARRLVPEPAGDLGATPFDRIALPHGSYRLRLSSPGRAEVLVPVLIERGGSWDGAPPGEDSPRPIAMPREGELGPNEVYVPAGWTWIGGDPRAGDSLPGRRVWIEGFVIGRFPVTNAEYIAFLNDLLDQRREAEALAVCPRAQLGMDGERLAFARDERGHFSIDTGNDISLDHLGRAQLADAPVTLIDWHGASAYAAWLSARTGKPWRLPNELEREKAARGVDRRLCPAGNHLDARFMRVLESVERNPAIVSVFEDPLDESPYGARGLGGNTRDYCENAWRRDGPRIEGDRLVREIAQGDEVRAARGGAWSSSIEYSRSATRFGNPPSIRRLTTGARVARSYPS